MWVGLLSACWLVTNIKCYTILELLYASRVQWFHRLCVPVSISDSSCMCFWLSQEDIIYTVKKVCQLTHYVCVEEHFKNCTGTMCCMAHYRGVFNNTLQSVFYLHTLCALATSIWCVHNKGSLFYFRLNINNNEVYESEITIIYTIYMYSTMLNK